MRLVHADSPGSESGIEAGYRITRINGLSVTDSDAHELQALFREKGATVKLVLSRGDKENELSLKLRRVI
jgi:C-terminal processing protease CtpA/Prc